MFVGLLSVAVGVIVLLKPSDSLVTLAVIAGIFILIDGAFDLDHRAWNVAVGLLEAGAGIVIVSSPPISFATLALLVGIAFIIEGMGQFVLGWLLHGLHQVESTAHGAGAPA